MDNAVYGLTKGQASPTSPEGQVTSSTPYGNAVQGLDPLRLYLTLGVSFVASAISSKVKDLSQIINAAMDHPGFAVVHVQSPCTTYYDTYDQLKGNTKKGIERTAWAIPDHHDPEDLAGAYEIVNKGGVPLGVIYQDESRETFNASMDATGQRARVRTVQEMVDYYAV